MSARFILPLCILTLPLASLFGCKPQTPITVELVPKDRSGIQWMRDLGPSNVSTSPRDAAQSTTSADPTRMVVAIFQRSEAAWFFKITGSPEKVAASESAWQPFLDAVKFKSEGNSERPVWELPEGWSLGGKAQMVFAILKMPETDAEIRISRLGGQQDLLSNVNRWRGQLALPPATADSLDENLAVKAGEEAQYRLFDQLGESAGQSMGGPFMRRQAIAQAEKAKRDAETVSPKNAIKGDSQTEPPAVKSPAKLQNELAVNSKFTLVPPEGYSPGKTSAMVVARFIKETDEGKVQISLVPLTATNKWNDNVNFWRQSVGLKSIEAAEIEAATEAVTISGVKGKKIALMAGEDDENDSEASKSLIGVMVKHDDAAWFFKMMGENALVKSDQAIFDAFLESFEFTPTQKQ